MNNIINRRKQHLIKTDFFLNTNKTDDLFTEQIPNFSAKSE